jgi:sugar phosphate isomerase/epimerase
MEQLDDLIRMAGRKGLMVKAITSSRFDIYSLSSANKQLRTEAIECFTSFLCLADKGNDINQNSEKSEKPVIVISAYKQQKTTFSYEQAFNSLFDSLERLSEIAERESVMLAMENPGSGLLLSPLELRELIDEINSPYFGICFNPDNVGPSGDPIDWLRILDKRVIALRLPTKDVAENGAGDSQDVIVTELEHQGFNSPAICNLIV